MLNVLDLFSGIGGFSLGLERTGGFKTVAFCEIEPFCQKVLGKHWPDVPIYEDIRELTGERLRQDGIVADVITGGFPCQPFSTASAGKRTAIDFWPEMRRIVGEVRPRIIIAENVQETPIARAEQFFRSIGYQAFRKRISGFDGGAPHRRNRWWAIAHSNVCGKLHGFVDAKTRVLSEICDHLWGAENYARAIRVPDGIPNRMDRIRGLGGAVIPQIPELIGRAILEAEG